MDQHSIQDVYFKLTELIASVNKSNEIEAKVNTLWEDKIIRDTTIKNAILIFKILAGLNLGAIITFLYMVIRYFSKFN